MQSKHGIAAVTFFAVLYITVSSPVLLYSAVYNLDYIKKVTLENNRAVLSSKKKVDTAKSKVHEAAAGYLPVVSALAKYQYTSLIPEMNVSFPVTIPTGPTTSITKTIDNSIKIGDDDNWMLGVAVQQNIFSWNRVRNAYSAAKNAVVTTESEYIKTCNDAVNDAATAFYTALFAKELVETHRASLDRAEEHRKTVESKFNAGAVSKLDLLRAKTQVANTEPLVVQAQNMYDTSLVRLKHLMALEQNTEVILNGKLEYVPVEIILNDCISSALKTRSEPAIAATAVETAKLNTKIVGTKNKPTLFGLAGYQYQYPFYSKLEWKDSWYAGLTFNWQIFTGFAVSNAITQGKLIEQQAEIAQVQVRDGIIVEITQSVLKLHDAKERIKSQVENVALAEEMLKIANISFSNGCVTNQEVLDAQMALTLAGTNYLQAVYDYTLARIALDKAMGKY
ncbi:MAG: TolC family protein [Elusimicrobiota bacterium]